MTSGIYILRCNANGKQYVGSSSNLERRKTLLLSDLRNGKSHNSTLLADFQLYGESAFEFFIAEIIENNDEILSEAEEFWINRCRSRDEHHGYNRHIAQRPKEGSREKMSLARKTKNNGIKHTEEAKLKMSRTKKESGTVSGINNGKAKLSKKQFDEIVEHLSMNIGTPWVKQYEYLARAYGVSARTIKRIKLGSHHFYGEERVKFD